MQKCVLNSIKPETTRNNRVSQEGNDIRTAELWNGSHDLTYPQVLSSTNGKYNFQDLPNEIMIKILEMLKYEEMAKSRRKYGGILSLAKLWYSKEYKYNSLQVCKSINGLVKYLLNRGYMVLGNIIEKTKSDIKKELPRRESLRRSHRLSGLSDAYSAVDTRYALLSMTYRKYIDSEVACFIPGKVLDECFRVLGLLKQYYDCGGYFKENINELLRDFRDLSSMAMEHFEEHIQPLLKIPQKSQIGETYTLANDEIILQRMSSPTILSTSRPTFDVEWARTINEKIINQESIIKKQNITINTLKLAVSRLGSICSQLANKSGVDYNINAILKDLHDTEPKSEFTINFANDSTVRKRSYHLYNNSFKRRKIQNNSELSS